VGQALAAAVVAVAFRSHLGLLVLTELGMLGHVVSSVVVVRLYGTHTGSQYL